MTGFGAQGWFAITAAGMAVTAMLFVLPHAWWQTAQSSAEGRAPGAPSQPGPRWHRAVLVLALPAVAGALYLQLGDPRAIDPQRGELSARMLNTEAPLDDAQAQQVYAELEQHLQRQPDDARARVLKARLDMQAQRFEQAAAGFERALQGTSKTVADATVWVEHAEARAMLQGATLAGQPRQLVDKALSLNPDHARALDLAGSAAWEAGEFTLAGTHWRRLLAQLSPGSPRHVQLSSAIQRAEQRARFALPPPR